MVSSASSVASLDENEKVNKKEPPTIENGDAQATASKSAQVDAVDIEKVAPLEGAPPPPRFDPSQFPDGGLDAWLCVLGGFCCLFCSFGWINCIGVFQNIYEHDQLRQYSPSTVSWISSLETFMMFAGGPVFGKIYDNYGPRYLLAAGTFLNVFGLMMTSISTEYYQFVLAQGICSPLGASCVFYPAMSTVSSWFFKRRALAFGIIASGSSLGGVVFPITVQHLLNEVGFPWTMRIAAFMMLALLLIANLTVKSRLKPRPTPLVFMDFLQPLREPTYRLVAAGSFVFFLGMFLPINYIIVEARSYGMSPGLANYLIPILNAASIFGRILPGYIADFKGRFNVHIIMMTFTATTVLALWLPGTGNIPIIIFAALYGFGSGAFVSLAPAVTAQISPDVTKIGMRTGTMFAIISIAALVGTPIGGALITRWEGKPTGLQIFGGVMQLGGVGFVLVARYLQVGLKLKVKV